mmetsp:Transcript_41140/g.136330  ORF Transcript_41140/g.136330 Transcript_41140/m.136330 type:complete len:204 (+) Transcript_41140:90-701(+)
MLPACTLHMLHNRHGLTCLHLDRLLTHPSLSRCRCSSASRFPANASRAGCDECRVARASPPSAKSESARKRQRARCDAKGRGGDGKRAAQADSLDNKAPPEGRAQLTELHGRREEADNRRLEPISRELVADDRDGGVGECEAPPMPNLEGEDGPGRGRDPPAAEPEGGGKRSGEEGRSEAAEGVDQTARRAEKRYLDGCLRGE